MQIKLVGNQRGWGVTLGAIGAFASGDNWSEHLASAYFAPEAERVRRDPPPAILPVLPPIGDWSDVKPSLGSGPLESGVFDRPEPEVLPVLLGSLARGIAGVSTPIVRTQAVSIEMEPERGGGYQPGGPFETAPPTDWSEVTILDDAGTVPAQEDEAVAIDWGSVVSGAIDIAQGQTLGGGVPFAPQAFSGVAPGGALPREITVDTVTGEVKKCKRRRRRRLLTPTDLSDLAALSAIVGKGDALKLAVAKAVRR